MIILIKYFKKNTMTTINNMLELQMLVLQNIHENEELFKKELFKSIKWLKPQELLVLRDWLMKKYFKKHSKTISEIFREVP
jgi:hypothetical protein